MDPFGTQKRSRLSPEQAEELAISALSYLSQTPDLMQRFLSLSGIEASSIREAASEPHFFAGVLKFFLAHEPTLIGLCAAQNLDPQDVARAVKVLPGGQDYV